MRNGFFLSVLLAALISTSGANAASQLLLSRTTPPDSGEYKGVVELTVNPGFDDARVSIIVDGQRIIEALRVPYKTTVDFGPRAIEHKITVIASATNKREVRWQETVNSNLLPLGVKLHLVDRINRMFEAETSVPQGDSVVSVHLWNAGREIAEARAAPYRFAVSAEDFASGFLQVTVKTKSGEEATDFWSPSGEVHIESVAVRTVSIFVSVVDQNGAARDDLKRSMFKITDNDVEGKILEFGKAFDQPISIALLIDASGSMESSMPEVAQAALAFVKRVLKPGDRCMVIAIHGVPRREQNLTDDVNLLEKAVRGIRAGGETALYDAIGCAIRSLKGEKGRRAIVVLTDGGDNVSNTSFEETDKLLAASGVPLYAISYDTAASSSPLRDVDRLRYLAAEGGGFVAEASSANLQSKYGDIEKDLRTQYAIVYQIMDLVKAEWRKVRVAVNSPRLSARTIQGYFVSK